MRWDDWFLTPEERGNRFSNIDARRPPGVAWTENNHVSFLIDGENYFEELVRALSQADDGDEVRFTDWRSDADERLSDDGATIATMLTAATQRGVDIRGLLWRSHSDLLSFSFKENRTMALALTSAGGEVLLDERVRRGGSHHQKLFLIRHPQGLDDDVAFVGGIDLSHGRRDGSHHLGDAQIIRLDDRYGPQPAWHDVQLAVRGPVVDDLDLTFRERWEDPTPLNHAGRLRSASARVVSRQRTTTALPPRLPVPPDAGHHAVQVLRTYPLRRPRYPFAPAGERSVARAFAKAIRRARTLIYIEDQYFWSTEIARLLASALRDQPSLQLIVAVPRFPDKDGKVSGPPSRLAQERAIDIVRRAGGDRVAIFDVENEEGWPIYVHAKVCVIDDVWVTVGSDNLNRRSWTHDSELSCAVLDAELDLREPRDPGGLGDGSRRFARNLRIALWAEHLGLSIDDPELVDVRHAVDVWNSFADGNQRGDPTACRVRYHEVEPVARRHRGWAAVVYRLIFDPDGRPFVMRHRHRF